jgi:hypothetical protein
MLLTLLTGLAARYAARMPPILSKKLRNVFESIAFLRQAQEPLIVQGTVKALVNQVALIDHAPTEEGSDSRDVTHAVVAENEVTKLDLPTDLQNASALVDPGRVAI